MHRRVGELLVERGVVTAAELEAVVGKPGRILSNLWMEGKASEAALVVALAEQHGVPGVDLSRTVIALSALELVPRPVALEHLVLPIASDAERIHLAMANPADAQVVDELRFVSGKEVIPHASLLRPLLEALDRAYGFVGSGAAVWPGTHADPAAHPAGHVEVVVPVAEVLEVVTGDDDAGDEPLFSMSVEVEEVVPIEEEPAPTPGGRRALVVDDEEDICRLLEKALSSRGFEVETATRGLEALEKVKTFRPNVLLLDAMLPEVHGFEICRKVKSSKSFGSVPILMVSAIYRGWRFAQDVKETYGADAYLEKPFRLEEVLRKVEELLAGPASRPEIQAGAAAAAYDRGIELFKEGRYAEAREAFDAGVKDDPFSARLHAAAARAAQELGDDYGAIASYERALELKPDLFEALRTLAGLYGRKGFRRKSAEVWERALRVAPDDATRSQIRDHLLNLL